MTDDAVRAAATAAKAVGLTVTDPTVLYDAFSVVVHLKPSPVVARVPVTLPDHLMEPEVAVRRQQRELNVAAWLAEQGKPVAAPSPLVPLEPVRQDGFSMTFWQFVEQDRSVELDFVDGTARAAELHAVLTEYPQELPWMAPLLAVPSVLADLEAVPGLLEQEDVDRARAEWEVLGPILTSRAEFEAVFAPLVPRLPALGDGIRMFVGQWRDTPFAGGLG